LLQEAKGTIISARITRKMRCRMMLVDVDVGILHSVLP
jgi:hypothetical protein